MILYIGVLNMVENVSFMCYNFVLICFCLKIDMVLLGYCGNFLVLSSDEVFLEECNMFCGGDVS